MSEEPSICTHCKPFQQYELLKKFIILVTVVSSTSLMVLGSFSHVRNLSAFVIISPPHISPLSSPCLMTYESPASVIAERQHNSTVLVKRDGETVYIFRNVCIEVLPTNERKIAVYDSVESKKGIHTLEVAGPTTLSRNFWDIDFKNPGLPTVSCIQNNTAFFFEPSYAGNFHHFITENFIRLYSVVKYSQSLRTGVKNRIVYKNPITVGEVHSKNKYTFQDLLLTLNAEKNHTGFSQIERTTCYKYGVFGIMKLYEFREMTNFILASFAFSKAYDEPLFVTIVQRRDRIILNIEDLTLTVKNLGFPNVRTIYFEDARSIKQQTYIAATSFVMIGVNGAALQWGMFMKPNSHVVEIAWPQMHWIFFYSDMMKSYCINHHQIVASHVQVNWTTYSRELRNGVPLSEEEKLAKLKNPVLNIIDNLYKFADVAVPLPGIKKTLEQIAKNNSHA